METLPLNFESGFLLPEAGDIPMRPSEPDHRAATPAYHAYFKKPVDVFETVIISDLHLGDRFCRARELLHFLQNVRFNRLIINGDVFDDINMKRLNRHHWQILSCLRGLTDRENNIEVVWLRGNHDGYSDLISQLLGVEFLNEYLLQWQQKRILVIHGDVFDGFASRFSLIGSLGGLLYKAALYADPQNRKIGSWMKRNSRTYLRNLEKVRAGAVAYARHRHADVVICGHTHFVEDAIEEGVRYLNCGSWAADSPSHFVGITTDELKVVPFV